MDSDVTRSTARPSLTISSGIGATRGLSSSSRSSPRSRRDILPTFDSHSLQEKAANASSRTSLLYRNSGSFKARKEGRDLAPWISTLQSIYQSTRHLFPWLTFILVWFFLGFHLSRWSVLQADDMHGLYVRHSAFGFGRNESEYTTGRLPNERGKNLKSKGWFTEWVPQQIGTPSKDVLEHTNGDEDSWILTSHAEEDMAEGDDTPRNPLMETTVTKNGESHINNCSHHLGRIVGPFDDTERRVLGTLSNTRACSSDGSFPDFVKRKNFVVVFHELSMTGAPLAMLELASKIVNCGGKVSAVVLNKRGGLYKELVDRGIMIVRDKFTYSWKAAARADLVVASSAACNAWIGQYLRHNRKGGERLIWWLMENRREYFDRSKLLLGKAHALVFLSETQEQLWRQWAMEDALVLPSTIKIVSLSVSDALAATAGLNDEAGNDAIPEAEKKREILRDRVRKEMGLQTSDYLVISLSSINPGKGQLLMLQAALMVTEDVGDTIGESSNEAGLRIKLREPRKSGGTRNLKILLGSLGSKSNKLDYLEKIHELVDRNPNLAEMLLWTEATVHVAPLYAAADAYVMNAQGIGETFGRVTVEAMAFGLPVLGTDAGGTKEIVQGNITGLLHPAGHTGIPVLAQNLRWLLNHPEIGLEMGKMGRVRVHMYREGPMYEAMTSVFLDCVRERGG